jgi:UDP-N-acetylmuramoyl-tripeptide--D-alanyl-D-alanine ligase
MAISEAGGITIVNDAYNASPSSIKAAVDMLSTIDGRKVCIFGDMFELGGHAADMHKEVGEYAAAKKMDLLIAIGPLSRHMYEAFPLEKAMYYPTKEAFLAEWQRHLKAGDTALIKASRGMALEAVAEEISRAGGSPAAKQ